MHVGQVRGVDGRRHLEEEQTGIQPGEQAEARRQQQPGTRRGAAHAGRPRGRPGVRAVTRPHSGPANAMAAAGNRPFSSRSMWSRSDPLEGRGPAPCSPSATRLQHLVERDVLGRTGRRTWSVNSASSASTANRPTSSAPVCGSSSAARTATAVRTSVRVAGLAGAAEVAGGVDDLDVLAHEAPDDVDALAPAVAAHGRSSSSRRRLRPG